MNPDTIAERQGIHKGKSEPRIAASGLVAKCTTGEMPGLFGSRLGGSLFFAMLLLASHGCDWAPKESGTKAETRTPELTESTRIFVDVSAEAGLSFVHPDGASDSYEFPRSMGSGCGWLDANGDGRLDILLVHGGKSVDYRNSGLMASLFVQSDEGRFVDFSSEAGLTGTGYGMGIAIGDVDNDGDDDVYLTKYGPDQLFLNDSTGRFTEATESLGIVNPQWSTAAAMTDLNADGWLDIVVANYVDYFPGTFCADAGSRQEFCGPQDFRGIFNRVFMNLGRADDGRVRFEDRSSASGLSALPGKSLGLVCRDFDGDGDTDIFVANDGEPNQLWMQNDGMFVDEAHVRGVAVNRLGEPEAGMGTVMADFDGDGQADLLVTHLSGEMNTLWLGESGGYFLDQTSRFRFGAAGLTRTGFGVIADDLNCDGALDILVANGKVKRDRHQVSRSGDFWADYSEQNQIFLFEADDFREWSDGTTGFTGSTEVSRGLASGDFDQDGDLDLLVANTGGPARLYRNDAEKKGHWLCVRPFDATLKRVSYGAKVTVISADRSWTTEILPHTSYLSSQEPIAHFGLGTVASLKSVVVIWPEDPLVAEEFPAPQVDQRIELVRGKGVQRRRNETMDKVP